MCHEARTWKDTAGSVTVQRVHDVMKNVFHMAVERS